MGVRAVNERLPILVIPPILPRLPLVDSSALSPVLSSGHSVLSCLWITASPLYRQSCRRYILYMLSCLASAYKSVVSTVMSSVHSVLSGRRLTNLLYRQSCRLYILLCLANAYRPVVSAVMSSVHSVLSCQFLRICCIGSHVVCTFCPVWRTLQICCIGSHVVCTFCHVWTLADRSLYRQSCNQWVTCLLSLSRNVARPQLLVGQIFVKAEGEGGGGSGTTMESTRITLFFSLLFLSFFFFVLFFFLIKK